MLEVTFHVEVEIAQLQVQVAKVRAQEVEVQLHVPKEENILMCAVILMTSTIERLSLKT